MRAHSPFAAFGRRRVSGSSVVREVLRRGTLCPGPFDPERRGRFLRCRSAQWKLWKAVSSGSPTDHGPRNPWQWPGRILADALERRRRWENGRTAARSSPAGPAAPARGARQKEKLKSVRSCMACASLASPREWRVSSILLGIEPASGKRLALSPTRARPPQRSTRTSD